MFQAICIIGAALLAFLALGAFISVLLHIVTPEARKWDSYGDE